MYVKSHGLSCQPLRRCAALGGLRQILWCGHQRGVDKFYPPQYAKMVRHNVPTHRRLLELHGPDTPSRRYHPTNQNPLPYRTYATANCRGPYCQDLLQFHLERQRCAIELETLWSRMQYAALVQPCLGLRGDLRHLPQQPQHHNRGFHIHMQP